MKPSEVAMRIGIAPSTVRLWTAKEFKEYMSVGGQGGDHSARNLTEQDARILAHIARLKAEGAKADEIHLDLKRLAMNDWIELPALPDVAGTAVVPVVAQSTATAAMDIQTRALLREISTLQQEVERLRGIDGDKEKTIRDLTRQLASAETELRLYREGRLKPDSGTT